MVDINCDMGEGFGIYSFAEDAEIMPFIDAANVACGFHASDPNTMRKTVELAKKHILDGFGLALSGSVARTGNIFLNI